MSCLICEHPATDRAHIIPRRSPLSERVDNNIIELCPNHHRAFDGGYMVGDDIRILAGNLSNEQLGLLAIFICGDFPSKKDCDEMTWCVGCDDWMEECSCEEED